MRIAIFTLAAVISGCAQQGRMPSSSAATITDSGSTNSPGWMITVAGDGSANLAIGASKKDFSLPEATAAKFFRDLAAARALGTAEPAYCPKSASFGSTTKVTSAGWASPDLSCPQQNEAFGALAGDLGQIEKLADVNTAILDIRNPARQQPANLPHCTTPDGKYEIDIGAVADGKHFFAMITELPRRNRGAFDSYDVTGSSPFAGQGSRLNRFSKAEPFLLTLAAKEYEHNVDASLSASLLDQDTKNDGTSVGTPPIALHYEHIICTRWYR